MAFILVALAATGLLGLCLSRWIDRYYVSVLTSNLQADSRLVGRLSSELIPAGSQSVDPFAKKVSRDLGYRVTIIRPDGVVLGDSHYDIAKMDRHNTRPEVRRALASGTAWSIRYSRTLRTRMLYVTTRIGDKDNPIVLARLSTSLAEVDRARGRIHRVLFIAALAAFVLAGMVGARVAERIANPIQKMTAVARLLASGDLGQRAEVGTDRRDEIDELAATLNIMVSELQNMMAELAAEKTKLQTILDKTDDGLIVVDHKARVQMANPAAARLLDADIANIEGRTVLECTLNRDFSELVDRVFRTRDPASLEIQLATPEQTYLNVYVALLERPDGPAGAVIVMHDLTPMKRIDSIRRDFVANVSHELRTPLASIKAMAETIVLRGRKDPKTVEEFAEKITAEADRLTALSDDLLDLAKIEAGRRPIRAEEFALSEATARIASELRPRAEQKAVELSVEVPDGLRVSADREAVHQILANLVDNAVKYTHPGGQVCISASSEGEWVSIKLSDTGIGIPATDLPRIFERFYRVDKARSRSGGGTGLGLSIVKHLVEAHGGKVTVESSPGAGSIFTFTLPDAG